MACLYTSEDGAVSFRKLLRLLPPLRFSPLLGRERNRLRDLNHCGFSRRDGVRIAIALRADAEKQSNQDEGSGSLFFRSEDQ
jgi:hypothetical protein